MRRTVIFRNNMINVFSKGNWFVSTSIAACIPGPAVAAISITSRTMSHSIWFYWSLPVKSLKSFLSYKAHLPTETFDKKNDRKQELAREISIYLEKTIPGSWGL